MARQFEEHVPLELQLYGARHLALMQEASAEIKKLAQEGKCWQPVERDFKMPKYAAWPIYIARRYCS